MVVLIMWAAYKLPSGVYITFYVGRARCFNVYTSPVIAVLVLPIQ